MKSANENHELSTKHSDMLCELKWNVQEGSAHGFAASIGTYPFKPGKPARVVFSSEGADGAVIADSVTFVKVDIE